MLSDPEDEFDENAGNYSTTSSQKTAKQSQEHNDDWEQDFSSQEKVSNAWSHSSKVEQNQYDDWDIEELSSPQAKSDWARETDNDDDWEPKVTESLSQFSSVSSEKFKPLRRPNLQSGTKKGF